MALTDSDRDWVRDIGAVAVQEASRQVLAEHISSCPHGQDLTKWRNRFYGVMIGAVLFGGGVGLAQSGEFLLKLVTGP